MGMTFTREQQQVIDLRKRNLLVSAAAGSGKTAVLVERILSLITEGGCPMDIDELLIVTFTRAAAAEMRERIGAAIETRLLADPENAHLQRQQTLLYHAQITTIDSFCLFVVRNYFHLIGLEPDFRMGEEGELKLLRQDVLAQVLEDCYAKAEPEFLRLSETLATGKNDRALEEAVLRLYEFAMSDPWPAQWLRDCRRFYEARSLEEFMELPVYQALEEYLAKVAADWARMMEEALALAQDPDGPGIYAEVLEEEAARMEELSGLKGYPAWYRELSGITFGRLPAARKYAGDEGKKKQVQELRKAVKDSRKKLMEQFFFLEPEELVAQLSLCQPVVDSLLTVTLLFLERYQEKKREKNMLDFSDLEHLALEILVDAETKEPTEAARQLRQQYREIMIDEYQDSNYVQEVLLAAVARADNRFMVGDVKQSIYRFRMARPELFMEKYQQYGTDTEEEGAGVRIDLHRNFRSRPQVLNTVNDIFFGIMARDLGNVEYDEAAALYPGMEFEARGHMFDTEILVADPGEFADGPGLEPEEAGGGTKVDPEELEPAVIAMKIRELMESQLVTDRDTGALRPLRYRDIVILMRGVSRWGGTLLSVLKSRGIPAVVATDTGYFSAMEVQTMLHYLRLLDNPRQDIPMAAVLQSPLVGLSAEELARIRIPFRKLSFHEAVLSWVKGEPEGAEGQELVKGEPEGAEGQELLRGRLRAFWEQLASFRQRVSDTPVHELVAQVMEETGYLSYVSAMPGGSVRRANLMMLVEKAIAYEGSSYHGLYQFVRYINELQRYEVDFGEAVDEGMEDAVHIMTIHKSKGLEFPVVFAAGMGRPMNQQDSKSGMVLHPCYGIGLDGVDIKRRVRTPSLMRRILARQIQMENAGEELRVLYVALTRAREKLILTGTKKKAAQKLGDYEYQSLSQEGRLGFLERLSAGSYFDWVLPVLVQKGYPVRQVTPGELAMEAMTETVAQEWNRILLLEAAARVPREELEALTGQMAYAYPYGQEQGLKTKLSVSELKHRAIDQLRQEEQDTEYLYGEPLGERQETSGEAWEGGVEFTPYIPVFMGQEQEENVAALRGTAMHRVLECFDFSRDPAALPTQVAEMRQRGLLEERLHELISLPALESFLATELAGRMQQAARAGKLQKEKPFVMGKPAREVYPECDSDVLVVVQGIIDAFFEEEGELVIVDYKTDAVRSAQELRKRYQVQMDLYQEALERITEKKVKEKLLYSFRLKEVIDV